MQNKNKARLLIFLIMLVIGSIIFFKYKNSSEKIYRNETPSKIREIKLLDNDKFVFVAVDNYLDDVILFGQNYITTFSSHTLDTTNFKKTPPIGSEEYFQIISYSVHGKEKIVKFNLYELLGKNNLYRFVHNFPRRYLQNDDDYLTMDLEKLNMYDIAGHDIRSVLVSASGEKVKDISESEMEKIDRERKLYFSPKYDWDRGGISEQIDDNLAKYHLSRFKNFISPMNDEPSKINVSGSNFAKLFPEVGKNINYLNRIYFRPKQYNDREWFDNIIYWFAPEGQEVMELYATDETTGEKTQIHSYDEFVAWIKAHPKN